MRRDLIRTSMREMERWIRPQKVTERWFNRARAAKMTEAMTDMPGDCLRWLSVNYLKLTIVDLYDILTTH